MTTETIRIREFRTCGEFYDCAVFRVVPEMDRRLATAWNKAGRAVNKEDIGLGLKLRTDYKVLDHMQLFSVELQKQREAKLG